MITDSVALTFHQKCSSMQQTDNYKVPQLIKMSRRSDHSIPNLSQYRYNTTHTSNNREEGYKDYKSQGPSSFLQNCVSWNLQGSYTSVTSKIRLPK